MNCFEKSSKPKEKKQNLPYVKVGLLTTDTLQSFHFKKVHKSLLKLSTDDKEMT